MNPHFTVTLVPGDGIGPEIAAALVKVFEAAEAPITWDTHDSPTGNSGEMGAIVASAKKRQLLIKGPLAWPPKQDGCSTNVMLRIMLGLYATERPFTSFAGIDSSRNDVDILVVRENTEGAFTGIEYDQTPERVETVKVVTREASLRVAECAFRAASRRPRRALAVAHNANVMTKSEGLFLQSCTEVAKKHPTVSYREILLDHCCMELVRDPRQFDVLLLQNIYANNVSGLCAGLIGGLGLVPSASIGDKCAMFEAAHGSAPDIANKGIANPTALILSGVLLLRHVGLHKEADLIERAIRAVIARREITTPDIGGQATTKEFTQAVIGALHEPAQESRTHLVAAKDERR